MVVKPPTKHAIISMLFLRELTSPEIVAYFIGFRAGTIWLKNEANLTDTQKSTVDRISKLNLKTSRAYQIRLNFQAFFSQRDRESGEAFLNKWYYWATHSRLEPMIKAAKTIKAHWDGVLNWFDSQLTTGFIEGMNGLIQAAKSKARGYRSDRNFIAIAYLLGAKLKFHLPT